MKKQYIKPESHVVIVRLFGSILDINAGAGTASQGANHLSREIGSFYEDDEEESIEVNIWK